MKQEDKELLCRDLCGRLPYGVKILAKYVDGIDAKEGKGRLALIDSDLVIAFIDEIEDNNSFTYVVLHEVKPYLFPMSSMTEEQEEELKNIYYSFNGMFNYTERIFDKVPFKEMKYFPYQIEEFFNKNHFDYRELIPKGLAIDATNLNIY